MPTHGSLVLAAVCLWVTLLFHGTSGQGTGEGPAGPVAQSSGGCFSYHLRVDSNNTDYFYTCCDRLGGVTKKTDKDIKVPTFNFDCNPFRLNRTELARQAGFTCNGKGKAEKLCNRRWGWLSTDDCWVWSACFVEACKIDSTAAEQTCGDGRCDFHESSASCPLDCCPEDNPDTCIIKNSTCSKSCCGESTCCQSITEPISASSETFWLIVGSVVAAIFCLLYCCCFCCCCCCRSAYNSMFHTSKKRRHSFIGAGAH